MRKLIGAALLAVLAAAGAVSGQPAIQGTLTGSLGPGTFLVTGDCQVPAGQTLSLQPGTTLLFSGHYALHVYGHLSAIGTAADSIRLWRQFPDDSCRHGGIRLEQGSSDSSRLAYVHLDYGYNVDFPDMYGGGLLCWNAGVTITHSRFTHCKAQYGGAICTSDAQFAISDCEFSENTAVGRGGCIYAFHSVNRISDCRFINNRADLVPGVEVYDSDDSIIERCVVAHNSATSTAG